jgi:tape measure domain-containing protein
MREVAGFRKEYAELVKQVEKPLRQVNATRALESALESTGAQARQAKQRLSELQAELIRTDNPTNRLQESFRAATKELQRLERVEAQQANQLSRMRAELQGAGVDTTRLAAEQRRLNAELTGALSAGRGDAAARGIRERAAALKQQAVAQRQANQEAARENLGVNRYRALQAEIRLASQQYELLRRSGKLSIQELSVAQQQLTQRIRESKTELKELTSVQGGGGGFGGLDAGRFAGVAAGVAGVATLATQYASAVDPIKQMNAQLKLATTSQQEFAQAQQDSARIADLAQTPLTDTATLYARLVPPLRDVGRSQQDAANVTEAFALGLKISGTSAQGAAGAIQQYSQAIGSGVFQAEEYNSVVDGNIRLIRAFSEELGVTVGEFRKMVLAGEITSDVLADLSTKVLPKLRAEVESMPDTWAGATTRLNNSFQQLLAGFDQSTGASQKLIDKINSLANSMDLLGSGSTKKVAVGVGNATNEFAKLVPMLSTVALGIEHLGMLTGVGTFAENAEELAAKEGTALDARVTQFDMHAAEMKALQQRSAADAREILDQQVEDTEAALKKQVAAERKAASELAKAKQEQLNTQKRYKDALASLNAGPAQEASYGQASALKAGARQALQAGDVEEAKRQAQAALAILQELAEAGANTYGFAGFMKELQAIEESADQKGIEDAQVKLDAAKQAALQTKAALEELKDIKVAPTLDAEAQQKLLNDLAALAKQAAVIMTVPVTPVSAPSGGTVDPSVPAAATGGILRGPGTGTSDSILARLSNGEGILNARAVQHYGAGVVHQLNRLQLPKFASGGVAGAGISLPAIPPLSPALQAQLDGPSFPDLGRMELALGGESVSVYVEHGQAESLKALRLKFGRTAR